MDALKTLILVPTPFERDILREHLSPADQEVFKLAKLCGFGVIAAASASATLIAIHQPERVILVGIAGTLSDRLAVGQAYAFTSVVCDGIGVGQGDSFLSASELGWPMHHDVDNSGQPLRIHDRIDGLSNDEATPASVLLTVCAGSADSSQAASRRTRYPDADAEDMEGFGVAMSCALTRVPLTIIRGISNVAGDRDHASWKINDALKQASSQLVRRLNDE